MKPAYHLPTAPLSQLVSLQAHEHKVQDLRCSGGRGRVQIALGNDQKIRAYLVAVDPQGNPAGSILLATGKAVGGELHRMVASVCVAHVTDVSCSIRARIECVVRMRRIALRERVTLRQLQVHRASFVFPPTGYTTVLYLW